MDIETAAAIEGLNDSIVRLEQSSHRDVAELRGETRQLRADVTELRIDVAQLRVELREGLAENRRHAGVLFESLRDDIRVLAEGFATVSSKLDSLQH
jgi:hypothetical protein